MVRANSDTSSLPRPFEAPSQRHCSESATLLRVSEAKGLYSSSQPCMARASHLMARASHSRKPVTSALIERGLRVGYASSGLESQPGHGAVSLSWLSLSDLGLASSQLGLSPRLQAEERASLVETCVSAGVHSAGLSALGLSPPSGGCG